VAALVTLVAASATAAVSCTKPEYSPDDLERGRTDLYYKTDLPTFQQFKEGGVSLYLELRCGSLDCHGNIARGLRIYSSFGLRYLSPDASTSLLTGQGSTTAEEVYQNYFSAIGLEPEETRRVFSDQAEDVSKLLLVSKATNAVQHKGGAVVAPDQAGDRCMISWLENQVSKDACAIAADVEKNQNPPPGGFK
jgi:hypothetical protein